MATVTFQLPIDTATRRLGYYTAKLGFTTPQIASAIATAEGAPASTNNPGDLELGDIGYGTFSAAGGNQITNFPDEASGESALENQINLMVSGNSSVYSPSMTLSQAGLIYSGGSSNWANNVGAALGVDPDTTTLADLVSSSGAATSSDSDGTISSSEFGSLLSSLGVDTSSFSLSDDWPYLVMAAIGLYLIYKLFL